MCSKKQGNPISSGLTAAMTLVFLLLGDMFHQDTQGAPPGCHSQCRAQDARSGAGWWPEIQVGGLSDGTGVTTCASVTLRLRKLEE